MRASLKHHLGIALAVTFAAAVWLVSLGCAGHHRAGMAADKPTVEQIEAAQTPADHEALAAEYERLADEARQTSAFHERLAEHYAKPRSSSRSAGGPAGRSHLAGAPGHCQALAKSYAEAAEQYEALAKEHRGTAAELQ